MLQKKRSKAVWQLKYVLLLPLVLGMLVYTSCENDSTTGTDPEGQLSLEERLVKLNSEIEGKDSLTQNEREQIAKMAQTMLDGMNKSAKTVDGWTVKAGINTSEDISEDVQVPFAHIEEVPIFPGCEDAADKKACFTEKVQEHIRKHFNYPLEAQEQGIQGRVSLIFIIGTDGKITDIRKRGPHELLENEAVRIIERLPQMQPGKQKGKVVEVPFSIPITFKLAGKTSGTSDATRQAKDYIQVAGGLHQGNGSSYYKGKVMDSESFSLPGVNISIQGTEKGAVTDFDGNFAIAVEEGQVLSFQYKGLPTKTIEVTR